MKRLLLLAAALAVAGGLVGWAAASLPLFSPPRQITEFGHVSTIEPKGKSYVLRFDPALWLEGETANAAAVQAGDIRPGETVPNDYYIVDKDHMLLTYKLPANAHVTVLFRLQTTKVTVAKLAQLLKTSKPCGGFMLRGDCRLGFWLRYSVDTVKALDQQYQP